MKKNDNYFLLSNCVNSIKRTEYKDKYANVAKWLDENIDAISSKHKKASFQHLLVYYRYGIKVAFAVFLFTLFIAATNYPVPYNKTVGYVLNWSIKKENYNEKIFERYEWMNNNQIVTSISDKDGIELVTFKMIINDESIFESYKNDLKNENSIFTYEIQPISKSEKRSIFQRMLNIFIRIDAGNKSVEEIGDELSSQFNAAGFKNNRVVVKQGPSGKRYLFVTVPVDRSMQIMPHEKPPFLEVEVQSNGKLKKFVTPEMLMQDTLNQDKLNPSEFIKKFEGKTDSEIKLQIKEDLKKFRGKEINEKDIEIVRINGQAIFPKFSEKNSDRNMPCLPPPIEINIDEADKVFIRNEIFPNGNPGKIFNTKENHNFGDSLKQYFPEEIISVLVEK